MKRVAAYCRVSTDKEDQANSFESQKRYFKEYIERNPEWKLYQIFADEGLSGTCTKKRKDFNRMIELAKLGSFDLIITKEVSRFARNTVDTLQYTRELKKIGVGVLFMNDNINTLDPDAELRLTIMSSIAQEESRKISERVKWGQRRRMEQGVVFGRDMLGYDVKDGKMYINEEGAMYSPFRASYMDQIRCWKLAEEKIAGLYPSCVPQAAACLFQAALLVAGKLALLPKDGEGTRGTEEAAWGRESGGKGKTESGTDGAPRGRGAFRERYLWACHEAAGVAWKRLGRRGRRMLPAGYRIKGPVFLYAPRAYLGLYHVWKGRK